jgi:hypothetical protein
MALSDNLKSEQEQRGSSSSECTQNADAFCVQVRNLFASERSRVASSFLMKEEEEMNLDRK